jgi:hypothetical protein
MIDIHHMPSEELPISPEESLLDDESDNPETLIVAPPSLRERIAAAQKARMLQIQPNVDLPSDNAEADTES